MANVRKGHTVPAPQWWKHLRDWKRVFWHRQRQDDQRIARDDITSFRCDDAMTGDEQPRTLRGTPCH